MKNKFKYKVATSSATEVTYGMDVKQWTNYDGETEIAAAKGNHITIVECDGLYKAVASGDVVSKAD